MIPQFYDKNFKDIGIFTEFIEFVWSPKFFDVGDFSIYLTSEHYNSEWEYIKSGQSIGRIETVLYDEGSNGNFVTLQGFMCENMLNDEILTAKISFTEDKDLLVNLKDLIIQNYKKAELDIIVDGQKPGIATEIDRGEILTQIAEVLNVNQIGTRVDLVDNRLTLFLEQGKDLSRGDNKVTFSRGFNAVAKTGLTIKKESYKNYGYGICTVGETEQTLSVDLSKGERLRKVVIDVGSIDSVNNLKSKIEEALAERQASETISIDVIQDNFKYGLDYNVGDIVNVKIEDVGYSRPIRVASAQIVTKDGHEEISVELGQVEKVMLVKK